MTGCTTADSAHEPCPNQQQGIQTSETPLTYCALKSDPRLRRRVCLFGISGDPPTGTAGHLGIAQQLLEFVGDSVDEIRILPVYRHTFVEKRERLITFEHRMEMCVRAFSSLLHQQQTTTRVVISNAEYESWRRASAKEGDVNAVVGTAALLEYLQEMEPEVIFSFCLGADSFTSLVEGKWKESDRVIQLLQGRLIVVNRISPASTTNESDDHETEQRRRLEKLVESVSGAALLPPNPALGIVSSSQIRDFLYDEHEQGEPRWELNDETLILPSVLEYIRAQGLYTRNTNNNQQ